MAEGPTVPRGPAPDARQGADPVCENCGERNPVGSTFCASCHAYLAWETAGPDEVEPGGDVGSTPVVGSEETDPALTAATPDPDDPAQGRFRVTGSSLEVVVPVTGEPATLTLPVTNTSTRVDGYTVEAVDAPPWLALESDQVQLLPGTDDGLPVLLRVVSPTLVPAQLLTQVLRVRSLGQAPAHLDVTVQVTVPVLDVPVDLRAQPRLLRTRDSEGAESALLVDNTGSNRTATLRFAGLDPEQVVSFQFEPPVLEVRPASSAAVRLVLTAPLAEAGQEAVRSLTVIASEGDRAVETALTWHQATSARTEDPPVALTLEPSVVRVRDGATGRTLLTLDNRGGREWAHLTLTATDPERLVRVGWSQRLVHVPPGRTVSVEAVLEAPLPEPGAETSRRVTVRASEGLRTCSAEATFVQTRSETPMATLGLRLEPAVLRIRDADRAELAVVLDNRRGQQPVRVTLEGSDPERAVRFGFAAPVVTVPAGQVQAVGLRVDCRRPDPGQELARPITVTATDGQRSVEAAGSLVLSSSRSAMEVLALRLDPSVLRLQNGRRGSLSVVVDNRGGTSPVQVALQGDDPENSLDFRFAPPVLEVAAGHAVRTTATVHAPRIAGGQQLTRPITVTASDGHTSVESSGSVVQSAAPRRPLARILFTVLGGLAMLLGALGIWDGTNGLRGVALTADVLAGPFGWEVAPERVRGLEQLREPLGWLEALLTLGLVVAGLAVLVVFGLTAPSGRLSRVAAFLGALVLVSFFVAFGLAGQQPRPAGGALLVGLGCVAGYIGGALGRR
ncbi:hypothetical protein GCM10009616_21350 [Microlunatus lacustris]